MPTPDPHKSTKLKKYGVIASIIAAIITILIGVAQGASAVDNYFLKVADYESNEKIKLIERLNDKKQALEDKIFELNLKENKTPADKALLDRFKTRLQKLQ